MANKATFTDKGTLQRGKACLRCRWVIYHFDGSICWSRRYQKTENGDFSSVNPKTRSHISYRDATEIDRPANNVHTLKNQMVVSTMMVKARRVRSSYARPFSSCNNEYVSWKIRNTSLPPWCFTILILPCPSHPLRPMIPLGAHRYRSHTPHTLQVWFCLIFNTKYTQTYSLTSIESKSSPSETWTHLPVSPHIFFHSFSFIFKFLLPGLFTLSFAIHEWYLLRRPTIVSIFFRSWSDPVSVFPSLNYFL